MNELISQLKITQATLFSYMLKGWRFHWNVTGPNFSEYHEFFGQIYQDGAASVDTVSEHIRICETMAPGALSKFMEASKIADSILDTVPAGMFKELLLDNAKVIAELTKARALAEKNGKIGIQNDLEDLISQYDKQAWMLRSFS